MSRTSVELRHQNGISGRISGFSWAGGKSSERRKLFTLVEQQYITITYTGLWRNWLIDWSIVDKKYKIIESASDY